MPDLGAYAGTVLAAYGVTIGLLAVLIGTSLWRSARVRTKLSKLDREER